ncbi:hypothetical protein CCP4SC76_3000001 [Gammaproteobacteria bacterium]
MVLDLELPDGYGMILARELRTDHPTVGILVVTARGKAMEVVSGLSQGVDDYVRKPFEPLEVSARAQAILRRIRAPQPGASQSHGTVKLGSWCLDTEEYQLHNERGKWVDLTQAEFGLLTHLIKRAGRVQSREQLLTAIHSEPDRVTDRTIDVLIGRLRIKLDDDGFTHPELIQTVRGIGYRLVLPDESLVTP